jgi:adenylate cyclase
MKINSPSTPVTHGTVKPNLAGAGAVKNLSHPFGAVRYWNRFHVRMSALYGGVVLFVLTLMGVTFYNLGVSNQIQALQSRLRTAAISVATQVRPEIVALLKEPSDQDRPEYQEVKKIFQRLGTEDSQFVSIYLLRPTDQPKLLKFVVDYTGPGRAAPANVGEEYDAGQAARLLQGFERATVEDQFTQDKWGTVLSGYAPVRDASGKSVAVVGIDVSEDDVIRLKSDVLLMTLGVFGLAGCCIGLVAFYVGRSVRKPLSRITNVTTEIAAGHLESRLQITGKDEFGVLAQHLNDMAAGLGERDQIRATFGRFVSEDVARRILSSPDGGALGGEERLVSVMLTDLAGYSTISESLSPSDVVAMLNTYFALMGEVVERHNGCVIEFTGDGILCVFGAPEAMPNHAEVAVQCAVEMQAQLVKANREWKEIQPKLWFGQGTNDLHMRIGIHTGTVIAGNIGTGNRVKYTLIGDAVNVAARIEQLNKEVGTETLMTEETLIRLRDPLRSQAVMRGVHSIKGRNKPVTVYSI